MLIYSDFFKVFLISIFHGWTKTVDLKNWKNGNFQIIVHLSHKDWSAKFTNSLL